jgi:hypothetical protein
MLAAYKTVTGKIEKEKLFFEESLFFRVVFAFVDSKLSLGFYAAAFACILSPN